MQDVFIVDGYRTPIGKFLGAYKDVSAKDLAKVVIKGLMEKTGMEKGAIDEIIASCAAQPSNASNIGRVAALELDFPQTVSAYLVNRNCGSGLQAVVNGWQSIKLGEQDVTLIVGTENMSQVPYIVRGAREGFKLNHQQLIDALWEMLEDPVVHLLMGQTAEIVARDYGITREEQDAFALNSHHRASAAKEAGVFKREIIPVKTMDNKQNEVIIADDEGIRPSLTLEKLSTLKPVFEKDGTVTAGNACGMNDGAASLLLMSEKKASELGFKPRARIVSYAFVGLEPERMGLGPVYAVPKALEKAQLKIDDIDLFELNEAFAAQALACIKQLELDLEKVNIHGGAIALGHPVGATGVRLLVTLMNALEIKKKRYGVATLCIGGGLGGAIVIENLNNN